MYQGGYEILNFCDITAMPCHISEVITGSIPTVLPAFLNVFHKFKEILLPIILVFSASEICISPHFRCLYVHSLFWYVFFFTS
jgi:hypothetical protein